MILFLIAKILNHHFFKLNRMNKGDLVNKIAEEANLTKTQASDALNTALNAIIDTLTAGEKVTLVGFGTFSLTYREARTGRNPRQPGETIEIPSKVVPKFKAGKELSEAVNTDELKQQLG
jgi:DNA-binding protein HU-beta